MENTWRVYKDGEVVVCLSPPATLSHLQPWGISPRDSPVDELSLRRLLFILVSFNVKAFE